MNKDEIGKWAGQVWQALNDADALGEKQLKKAAKLRKDSELFAAIGWLAREGKVNMQPNPDDPKKLVFSLVQDK